MILLGRRKCSMLLLHIDRCRFFILTEDTSETCLERPPQMSCIFFSQLVFPEVQHALTLTVNGILGVGKQRSLQPGGLLRKGLSKQVSLCMKPIKDHVWKGLFKSPEDSHHHLNPYKLLLSGKTTCLERTFLQGHGLSLPLISNYISHELSTICGKCIKSREC